MKTGHVTLVVGALLVAAMNAPVWAATETETAELILKLMQAGRSVVAAHQEMINDSRKADKGFTPEIFGDRVIQRYRQDTNIDLRNPNVSPGTAKLLWALLDSGKEVVGEFQPVINKPGVGFKGFIPAKWGRMAADKFTQKTGLRLKLTSLNYRWPGNRPDDFEMDVLKLFQDPNYPKGKDYFKTIMVDGRPQLRIMTPEYVKPACLQCHGEPKGEKDITGMKKEGYKDGDVAGAISLTVPVR
ncbi:MAG TPA: DUF3365 domain-containing protein [Nitrospirales bacterium]|nr:DUF3365 domain-containing protein [Nitrospirales bacterium]